MKLTDLDRALEAIIPGVHRTLEIELMRGEAYKSIERPFGLTFQVRVVFPGNRQCLSTKRHTEPQGVLDEVRGWVAARSAPPSTEADVAKVGELNAAPVVP